MIISFPRLLLWVKEESPAADSPRDTHMLCFWGLPGVSFFYGALRARTDPAAAAQGLWCGWGSVPGWLSWQRALPLPPSLAEEVITGPLIEEES